MLRLAGLTVKVDMLPDMQCTSVHPSRPALIARRLPSIWKPVAAQRTRHSHDLRHADFCALLPTQFLPCTAREAHEVNSVAPCREMEKEAALVQKVSASFGRRDFLRRHMDKIEAMIADSGASAPTPPADIQQKATASAILPPTIGLGISCVIMQGRASCPGHSMDG